MFDPYYSSWTAEALLCAKPPAELVDELLRRLPLAVTLTLLHIGVPTTDYEQMIVEKIKAWTKPLRYSAHIPESIRGAVANSLIWADSPAVLDIATHSFGLEVPWLGDLARFRNGNAQAGVNYCIIAGLPDSNRGSWEQLVEHARQHHRESLTVGLLEILASAQDNEQTKGALALSGYLALPELHDAIGTRWLQTMSKTKHLAEALWATLRCSPSYAADDLLGCLGAYWAEMPDMDEPDREGWRQEVAEDLGGAITSWATQDLVNWLVDLAQCHEELKEQVAYLCGLVDLPEAIEHAVRFWAVNTGEPRQRTIEHYWGYFNRPRLSVPSVERLRALWENADNDPQTRKLAFSLWLENVDSTDVNVIAVLQQVAVSVPYCTEAVIARARMGDESCVQALLDVVRTNTRHFHVAHHVWCDDLKGLVAQFLASFVATIPPDFTGGKLDEHYALADLLLRIPATDAESLLLDNWDHLRFSPLFVQSALFVGTPRCVAMADESIRDFPADVNPLEHMDTRFGFDLVEWPDRPPLTLERLRLAGCYLDRLPDTASLGYVRACCGFGDAGIEWARDNAPTAWEWYRRDNFPTDADIAARLSELTKEHPYATRMYVGDLVKHNEQDHLLSALERWLHEATTASWRRIRGAAVILEMIGCRSDLAMLDVAVDLKEGSWGVQEAERIIEGVTFSVQLRSLR